MQKKIEEIVNKINKVNPLILNLTNHVTMDFVANGLLSLGASPIMTESANELEDLINIANGLVINIGTLNDDFIYLCEKALAIANQLNKLIVFDPVGVGASDYRTQSALYLLEKFNVDIIRGNASEINSLADIENKTKGVDSTTETTFAIESGKTLSQRYNAVVAISGKLDAIVKNNTVELIDRGSALMPKVTGSGCLLSAVVSVFSTVENDLFEACKNAILYYDICAEIAEQKSSGPGTFKANFLDTLVNFK